MPHLNDPEFLERVSWFLAYARGVRGVQPVQLIRDRFRLSREEASAVLAAVEKWKRA